MEYRRCQPPCALFIVSDDPHSKCVKCLGFSHAREAVYGISKCKFCENLRLRTPFLKRSHPFFPVAPRRPPQPPVSPRPGVRKSSSRRWRVSRQASPFLFLSLPSTCARILRLNLRMIICILARRHVTTVSFGLDDILLTAASDSENFGPVLADALPPSGQEARPTLSLWMCFHVPLRSSHWIGPMNPASLKHRNSTSGSLAARTPGLKGGS